jgi:hypothetical protein
MGANSEWSDAQIA